MAITVSELRKNIYRWVDEVLRTGKPLEVIRRGKRLKIMPYDTADDKLARLVPHDSARGDLEDFVHFDWSREWKSGAKL